MTRPGKTVRVAASGRAEVAGGKPARSSTLRYDGSYRAVLGNDAWRRLKPEIRSRFSIKPGPGEGIRYTGVMHRVELSFMGWLFAQFCRVFGTPLAPRQGRNVPMDIELREDKTIGGVAWHRRYDFHPHEPFTVCSTKRFDSGALTEHIGHGFSMSLRLVEKQGDLVFVSLGYFVRVAGRRLRIPDWLTPGTTVVRHEQVHGERFRFALAVEHPFLGRTIYQQGEFRSAP
ncbi:MAG: DUF4166 domain-containing protein [Woeseiaceae bacterium]